MRIMSLQNAGILALKEVAKAQIAIYRLKHKEIQRKGWISLNFKAFVMLYGKGALEF